MERHVPGKWAARRMAISDGDRKTHHNAYLPNEIDSCNRDCWIELYLAFIDREIRAVNAGVIGQHYRNCAEAFYQEFQAVPSQRARYRVWLGIRTCLQWMVQL